MSRKSLPRIAGAILLCSAFVVTAAVPAQADDLSSGSWYYDKGHVQDALDAGYTGKGVTIAVIDTQINTDVPTLRHANVEVSPSTPCFTPDGSPLPPRSTDLSIAAHATDTTSLIAGTGETDPGQLPIRGVAPGAKVLFYAVGGAITADHTFQCWDAQGKNQVGVPLARAIDAAVAAHADIVSISQGTVVDGDINDALVRAYVKGVLVVAALPNSTVASDDDLLWPVAANGVVAVQAFDAQVKIGKTDYGWKSVPNTNNYVKIAAPGLGILQQGAGGSWDAQELRGNTAMSTALVSGFLAVLKSKYPKATGNQLLQTMIRNTGGTHHEPRWGNDLGYGAISLTYMLKDDPTKYPDLNPFFDTSKPSGINIPNLDQYRAAGGVLATASPTATARPTPTPAAQAPSGGTTGWLPWTIGGGIVLVLLAGAGVVLAVRASARKGRERVAQPTNTETDQTNTDATADAAHADDGGNR